jgi:cytoskeletal protein RodZ
MEINQNNNTTPPATTGLPMGAGQKPGERLRQVRLSQKRELADIARELNMAERQLVAIEADDYKSLPEPAFVRGYLRSYARLLGVDANAVVARFGEIYTQDTGKPSQQALADSPLRPLARLHSRRHRQHWRVLLWVFMAMIALSLVYGLYIWMQRSQAVSNDIDNSTEPTTVVQDATPPQQSAPMVQTLPIAPSSNTDRLELRFAHAADVIIKDGSGKTLVTGQQSTDKPLSIDGVSPFGITLADAAAVTTLSLNGENVDLKPYTVNGRAEFRLSR